MIVTLLYNKIKSFILIFTNLFRKALCCFRRRRRRSSCDSVPLTHVISNIEEQKHETENWGNWEEGLPDKPKTVQDHIELYRKQTQIARTDSESPDTEEQLNFFENMTPRITKQTKVLINTDEAKNNTMDRLNFVEGTLNPVPTSELREWEESSGWENETLEHEAQRVLREKKRQDRERRALEQQQKRHEKMGRPLGSRLST
ncbi:uncharacterized protein [Leptinotarsa decemlineata]|uniref:uncharacterized protein n=1 Tax=Leptinotarsa decemlineata TaxID=7539 RepID=UPI000C25315C|nr:receptor-binding cancer antigen expressed on SiSo cells [Leptinotarsa decemlineata]